MSSDSAILDKVLMRVALAETTEALKPVLSTFLIPILNLITSPDAGVKKKVVTFVSHVNKRLGTSGSLLPAQKIIASYMDPSVSPITKNLTLVYLNKALADPATPVSPSLLRDLLAHLPDADPNHVTTLLHILAPRLSSLPPSPPLPPQAHALLLDFATDLLLFRPQDLKTFLASQSQQQPDQNALSSADVPPGLSRLRARKIACLKPPSLSHLASIKASVFQAILTLIESLTPDPPADDDANHASSSSASSASSSSSTSSTSSTSSQPPTADDDGDKELQKLFPIALIASFSDVGTVRVAGERALRTHFTASFQITSLSTLHTLSKLVTGDRDTGVRPCSVELAMGILPAVTKSPLVAQTPDAFALLKTSLFASQARMVQAGKTLFHAIFRDANASPEAKECVRVIARALLDMLLPSIGGSGLGSFGYVAVGRCARVVPDSVGPDLSILESFFAAAASGTPDDRSAVKEALADLQGAFVPIPPNLEEPLQAVLEQYARSDVVGVRLMALFYAMHLFPFSHLPSRAICIRLAGDPALSVAQEAARGLVPYVNMGAGIAPDPTVPYPEFDASVAYLAPLLSSASDTIVPFGLDFLVQTWSGGGSPTPVGQDTLETLMGLVSSILGTRSRTVGPLMLAAVKTLESFAPAWSKAGDPISLVPHKQVLDIGLGHSLASVEMREACARVLGILADPTCGPEFLSSAHSVLSSPDASQDAVYGACVIGGRVSVGLLSAISERGDRSASPEMKGLVGEGARLLSQVGARGSFIGRAVAHLLGDVGSCIPLPLDSSVLVSTMDALLALLPDVSALSMASSSEAATSSEAKASSESSSSSPSSESGPAGGAGSAAAQVVSSGSSARMATWCEVATALGRICVGDPSNPKRDDVVDRFFQLGRARGIMLHFSIADALACIALGVDVIENAGEEERPSGEDRDWVHGVLKRILVDAIGSGHSFLRQAGSVWLLALVEAGAGTRSSLLREHVVDIQSAFEYCLTDRDTLTQEIASTGLSVTYQLSDADSKANLLSGLVKTLSSGGTNETTKMAVQAGEPLFETAAMGLTPDGGSVSTYQEICSIATDVGSPELIYKFMGLARSNAMWNSRSGAAFGFAAIAESPEARAELVELFPVLIPKLFRYKYDPDGKVQSSMNAIWKAIVQIQMDVLEEAAGSEGATNATRVSAERMLVRTHFDAIVNESLSGIGNRAWRVRQASCGSLGAVLETSPALDKLSGYLEEMWRMAFRGLDDIKESVRMAALKTCGVLGSTTLKFCAPDADDAESTAGVALGIMMPFLLEKGLVSDAKPVAAFSLSLLGKIVKKARGLLKPHLALLTGTLLRAMSALEPQEFNYLTLNQDKYNLSTAQVEGARLAMSKSSPISRMLESALGVAEPEVLESVVPEVVSVIGRGVGLPTKVGAAKVVMDLADAHREDLKPFAKKLMKALVRAMHDPSPGVRSANTMALAYVARHARTKTLGNVLNSLVETYLGAAPGSDVPGTIGQALANMVRVAPGVVAKFGTDVLPVALLGAHDGDEDVAALFMSVWSEATAGNTGGVRTYAEELVALAHKGLVSDSWPLRKQAAAMLSFMADAAPAALAGVSMGVRGVLDGLEGSLSGRLWSGKEAVVGAYVDVAIVLARQQPGAVKEGLGVVAAVLVQVGKKKDLKYRYAVLQVLTRAVRFYASALKEPGDQSALYQTVHDGVAELALTAYDPETAPKGVGAKPLFLATQAEASTLLGAAYPMSDEGQGLVDGVGLVTSLADLSIVSVWNVRNAMMGALIVVVTRGTGWIDQDTGVVASLSAAVVGGLNELRYSSVRETALDLVGAVLKVGDGWGDGVRRGEFLAGLDVGGVLVAGLRGREDGDKEVGVRLRAKKLRRVWQGVR